MEANKITLLTRSQIDAATKPCAMNMEEHKFICDYMTSHNLNKLSYLQKKKVHLLYLQDRHKRAKDTKRER